MPGIMELTGAVLYRAKLDPVLRELVILRVGNLCGSSYEVGQHRKIAQAIGLAQAKIDGAARDADAIVVALKSRTVPAADAVRESLAARDLLAAWRAMRTPWTLMAWSFSARPNVPSLIRFAPNVLVRMIWLPAAT